MLIMIGDGGEAKYGTNMNYFLEEFGMMVNNDSVVSTVFLGSADKENAYVHPKVHHRDRGGLSLPFSFSLSLMSAKAAPIEQRLTGGAMMCSSVRCGVGVAGDGRRAEPRD